MAGGGAGVEEVFPLGCMMTTSGTGLGGRGRVWRVGAVVFLISRDFWSLSNAIRFLLRVSITSSMAWERRLTQAFVLMLLLYRSSIFWLNSSIKPVVLHMATIIVWLAVVGSGRGEFLPRDPIVAGKKAS